MEGPSVGGDTSESTRGEERGLKGRAGALKFGNAIYYPPGSLGF